MGATLSLADPLTELVKALMNMFGRRHRRGRRR